MVFTWLLFLFLSNTRVKRFLLKCECLFPFIEKPVFHIGPEGAYRLTFPKKGMIIVNECCNVVDVSFSFHPFKVTCSYYNLCEPGITMLEDLWNKINRRFFGVFYVPGVKDILQNISPTPTLQLTVHYAKYSPTKITVLYTDFTVIYVTY